VPLRKYRMTGVCAGGSGSRRRVCAGVVVLSLCLAIIHAPMHSAAQSGGSAGWSVVPSPDVNVGSFALNGVACTSDDNCWAAGYDQDGNETNYALIEQYNGTSWEVATAPTISNSVLNGITCADADDCWAVGNAWNPAVSAPQTLIEYYDGTGWTVSASANSADSYNSLSGVACSSAAECWAVGSHAQSYGSYDQTLVEGYNGTSWTVVSSADPGTYHNFLYGVACVEEGTACSAVGEYNSGFGPEALAESLSDGAWTVTPSSSPGTSSTLSSVTCAAATSCVAAGSYDNGGQEQALVEQFSGTSWQQEASAEPGVDPSLYGINCVASGSCWAVGDDIENTSENNYDTLTEGLVGGNWLSVASPNPSATLRNTLNAVACPSTEECFAVGYAQDDPDDFNDDALIEQYVAPPPPPSPTAVSVVPGNNQATVEWEESPTASPTPTGFLVEIVDGSGSVIVTELACASCTSSTIDGLSSGEAYSFGVAALDDTSASDTTWSGYEYIGASTEECTPTINSANPPSNSASPTVPKIADASDTELRSLGYQIVYGSAVPLAGGGTKYAYDIGSQVATWAEPPAAFNPATATSAELQMYDLPPRPAGGVELTQWLHAFSGMRFAEPAERLAVRPMGGPAIGVPDGACAGTSGVVASAATSNWSGYVNRDDGTYTFASANWTEPTTTESSSCGDQDVDIWAGLGGAEDVPGVGDIIQAGTDTDLSNGLFHTPWWEDYPGLTVYPAMQGSAPGDLVGSLVSYDPTADSAYYTVVDYTEDIVLISVSEPATYYDGTSAEYIVERHSYASGGMANLGQFSPMNMTAASWATSTTSGYVGSGTNVTADYMTNGGVETPFGLIGGSFLAFVSQLGTDSGHDGSAFNQFWSSCQ
jgi:hypothetical protein